MGKYRVEHRHWKNGSGWQYNETIDNIDVELDEYEAIEAYKSFCGDNDTIEIIDNETEETVVIFQADYTKAEGERCCSSLSEKAKKYYDETDPLTIIGWKSLYLIVDDFSGETGEPMDVEQLSETLEWYADQNEEM